MTMHGIKLHTSIPMASVNYTDTFHISVAGKKLRSENKEGKEERKQERKEKRKRQKKR